MADPKVEEIRARWSAATPGPWTVGAHPYQHMVTTTGEAPCALVLANTNFAYVANIEAIAHAPSDVAWLLAQYDDAWRLVELWRNKYNALGTELDAADGAEARSEIEIESELLIVVQSAFSYRQHQLRFGSDGSLPDVRARLRALCSEYIASGEPGAESEHVAAPAPRAPARIPIESASQVALRLGRLGPVNALAVAKAAGCARSTASNELHLLYRAGKMQRVARGAYVTVEGASDGSG